METTCLNSRLQKERVLVGNYSEYSIVIRFPNMVKHRIHVWPRIRIQPSSGQETELSPALALTTITINAQSYSYFYSKVAPPHHHQQPPGGISPLNILPNAALDWDKP